MIGLFWALLVRLRRLPPIDTIKGDLLRLRKSRNTRKTQRHVAFKSGL